MSDATALAPTRPKDGGLLRREYAPAIALALLLTVVGVLAPSFFSGNNVRDLALNNAAVLLVAVGMTLVIVLGEIDISVASQFAICSVVAGAVAKAGVPIIMLAPAVIVVGAAMGAINGLLIGKLKLPSIIVTLAMLVAWRDLLRWITEGAWVQDLPSDFQWFGIGFDAAIWVIGGVAMFVVVGASWGLRNLSVGRTVYAVGSDGEAARLAGIDGANVTLAVFMIMGALVGLAATLNAVRFNAVPSNAGVGLEMKAIAAVVVGGVAITGGRGTLLGTVLGVCLLGTIGTALSFLGINPYWEKAIQGVIILAALVSEVAMGRAAALFTRSGGGRVVAH